MFERFTEPARKVIVLAQEEARTLKHNHIGTEHILLGLLREQDGVAARVLESLDVNAEPVRERVVRIVGYGHEPAAGQIPFTPRAKRVFDLALREALSLGHDYIATEHMLLALTRESDGVAAGVLSDLDAGAEQIRSEVRAQLSRVRETTSSAPPPALLPTHVAVSFSAAVQELLASAATLPLGRGETKIALHDLLQAIVADESVVAELAMLLGEDDPGAGRTAPPR